MTRRVSRIIRNAPIDGQRVYVPHSSWTRPERRQGPTPPIAAKDFWARLGI